MNSIRKVGFMVLGGILFMSSMALAANVTSISSKSAGSRFTSTDFNSMIDTIVPLYSNGAGTTIGIGAGADGTLTLDANGDVGAANYCNNDGTVCASAEDIAGLVGDGTTITVPVYADATARDAAISSPEEGQMIYNTDTGGLQTYNGTSWESLNPATTLSGLTDLNVTSPADGHMLVYDATSSKWVNVVISGDVTIDETGAVAIGGSKVVSSMIAADTIVAGDIATSAVTTAEILDGTILLEDLGQNSCTDGQILSWDNTGGAWVCSASGSANLSGLSDLNVTSPADGHMLVYDATSSKWVNVVISGDVTIDETGAVTIGGSKVVSSMIAADTIVAGDIATSAVTTAEILDGTILLEDLGQNSCTDGQILSWDNTGGEWVCSAPATSSDLQDVSDNGSVTTNNVEAASFTATAKTASTTCNAAAAGTIEYVVVANLGTFYGCAQQDATTYEWVVLQIFGS